MKKIISILLIAVLMLSLAGCTKCNEPEQIEFVQTASGEGWELVSCSFADSVYAGDIESTNEMYAGADGKVFVDIVIKTTDKTVNKNDYSAMISHADVKYNTQLDIGNEICTAFNAERDDPLSKTVHIFTHVPETLMSDTENVPYVILTAKGEKYNLKIAPKEEAPTDPLSTKTEVTVGNKYTPQDGKIEFEVLDITISEYLKATAERGEKYTIDGTQIFDCVIKLTNNVEGYKLSDIYPYVLNGEDGTRGDVKKETEDNKEIVFLENGDIASGDSLVLHIYATLEEDTQPETAVLRFNFAGSCFYCKAPIEQ